jgi:transposase InsO family protein
MRLRELAASRVRFGYRRLTVLLRREGWQANVKRIYRLYTDEWLTVRTHHRTKATFLIETWPGPGTSVALRRLLVDGVKAVSREVRH